LCRSLICGLFSVIALQRTLLPRTNARRGSPRRHAFGYAHFWVYPPWRERDKGLFARFHHLIPWVELWFVFGHRHVSVAAPLSEWSGAVREPAASFSSKEPSLSFSPSQTRSCPTYTRSILIAQCGAPSSVQYATYPLAIGIACVRVTGAVCFFFSRTASSVLAGDPSDFLLLFRSLLIASATKFLSSRTLGARLRFFHDEASSPDPKPQI